MSKTTTVGTPKISTSGKIGYLTLEEMDGTFGKTVGYNIDPQTEQMTPITKWGEYKVIPGQQAKPFVVTKEGVVLPRNAYIPKNYIENPYRSSSYGVYENGKFIEKLRIDPATQKGFKGPNENHFHINGGSKHIFEPSKWPFYKE
ncbi:hypothetical protein D1632_10705 [Chryseobacterium nematophagum]|uniref:Uncharacterized protein n=1 Tax=Chryseobacterium nematophagum TaxID=2305228 RepID=A0A3M7LBD7_9FLAO|nr:hypothetical protein [Chryseobacterium nematophagum]RMZ60053.1 hypothetical protein D1632_10705 [Chryseobacterium nematophagum]